MNKKIKTSFLKLFFGIICCFIVINCSWAAGIENNTSSVSDNKSQKTFELPSKIHKDGEGFYYIGKMLTPRYYHSAALLQDGRIFIVGGLDKKDYILKSTEIFNPKTGKSVKGPDLPYQGFFISTKLLSNGNVLLVGGWYNNDNRVSVYIPKENKIIEVNGTLSGKINKKAVIEEISDSKIFIGDGRFISSRLGVDIYNQKINQLSICHLESQLHAPFDYYIGNIDDKLYFLSIGLYPKKYHELVLNILETIDNGINKYSVKSASYGLDMNAHYNDISRAILLKDKKTLFIYNALNDVYVLFDTRTETFKKLKLKTKVNTIHKLTLLENGNIIFFNYSNEPIKIIELNPYTGLGEIKPYKSPNNPTSASVLRTDGGDLLYIGGANPYEFYHNVSDKIYVWKTKKENN